QEIRQPQQLPDRSIHCREANVPGTHRSSATWRRISLCCVPGGDASGLNAGQEALESGRERAARERYRTCLIAASTTSAASAMTALPSETISRPRPGESRAIEVAIQNNGSLT